MNSDPPRLLDDPSVCAALRSDMSHASNAALEGLDLVAGLERLQTATAASPATAAGGVSMSAKVGLGVTVVAAAAALWLGRPLTQPPPATTVATAPAVETSVPSEPRAERPAVLEAEAGPPVDRAAPAADSTTPMVVPVEDDDDGADVEPRVTTRTETEPEMETGAKTDAGHSARRAKPTPTPSTDDVLREARMVAQARAALSSDPARALELAERVEKDFPEGQLVEERRAIAIRALAALGRVDEARRRADAFLDRFGRGAHADAVRRAIAEP